MGSSSGKVLGVAQVLRAWLDPGVQTTFLRAGRLLLLLCLLLWHPLLLGSSFYTRAKKQLEVADSHPHRAAIPAEENFSSFSGTSLELSFIA